MNIMKIKLCLPELKLEEIKFAFNNSQDICNRSNTLLGLIILVLWRAQLSASQTEESILKKDLQSVPTMKLIAKIIGNDQEIHNFLAAVAVFRTAFFGLKDFEPKNESEKEELLCNLIRNAIQPGKTKMLSPRQIITPLDLQTHQRGLVLSIKGIISSQTLYKPSKILQGINILHVDWEKFHNIILIFLKDLGIDPQVFFSEIRGIHYDKSKTYEPDIKMEIDDMQKSITSLIASYTNMGFLYMEDGILVSQNENNSLPLESFLGISRNKPVIFKEKGFFDDDPFTKAALRQMQELKRKDKNLFGNSKKFGKRSK